MSICRWCSKSMKDFRTKTCTANKMIHFANGVGIMALPWYGPGLCPECHVGCGGHHHPGCTREKCPKCKDYIVDCDCTGEDGRNLPAQEGTRDADEPLEKLKGNELDHLLR